MINICNIRTYNKPLTDTTVLVARPSVFGNPWPLRSERDRIKVILKYEDYFLKAMDEKQEPLYSAVQDLIALYKEKGQLTLLCYCAPNYCHSEVIRDYVLGAL